MALVGPPREIDILAMRQLRAEQLTHCATIIEVVHTRTDLGFALSEQVIATSVPCLYQPTAADIETTRAGPVVGVTTSVVTFLYDAIVKVKHRLIITGTMHNAPFTVRLGVTGVNIPRAYGLALKASCTSAESEAGKGPAPEPLAARTLSLLP